MTLRWPLALLFVVAGCAAPNVDKEFDLRKADKSGVAIGSITHDGTSGAYAVPVRSARDGSTYRLQHGVSQTLIPFGGPKTDPRLGGSGSVFAVELPAGDYAISVGASNVRSTAPSGLAFSVAGTAIHLGNFDFLVTDTFMPNPTKAVVRLSDKRSRDLAVFADAFPKPAAVPVLQAIATDLALDNVGGASSGTITIPVFVPIGG